MTFSETRQVKTHIHLLNISEVEFPVSGAPYQLEPAVQALAAEAAGGQGRLARPLLRPHRQRLLLLVTQCHDISSRNLARSFLQPQGKYYLQDLKVENTFFFTLIYSSFYY